jgi:hypothetical protein
MDRKKLQFLFLSAGLQLILLLGFCPAMLSPNGGPVLWGQVVVCAIYYAYMLALLAIVQAVVFWRTTGKALVFSGSFSSLYLALSCTVAVRYGVHLDHPSVRHAFARTDLNFGIEPEPAQLAALIGSGAALFSAHWLTWRWLARRPPPNSVPRGRYLWRVVRPVLLAASVVLAFIGIMDQLEWKETYLQEIVPALPGASLAKSLMVPLPQVADRYVPGPPIALKRKPHVLFILVDTLRWDQLTPEIMPNLYRFASRADCVRPAHHYSGGTITATGSYSFLTGLYAHHYPYLAQGRSTSPAFAVLKSNGYKIVGLDGSGLLDYSPPVINASDFDEYHLLREKRREQSDLELASSLIKRRPSPGAPPHFLFGFFYSPHDPYFFPPGAKEIFTKKAPPAKALYARYQKASHYVDELLGKVLEAYEEDWEAGKLVIAVTGDHGEEFGEFGLVGHASVRFQYPRIRVPLVLCLPGTPGGAVELSQNADVLPTIFDWAGADAGLRRRTFEGLSLISETRSFAVVTAADFPRNDGQVMLGTKARNYFYELPSPALSSLTLRSVTDGEGGPVSAPDHQEASALLARFQGIIRSNLQLLNSPDPLDHSARLKPAL